MTRPLHIPGRRGVVPLPAVGIAAGLVIGLVAWQHQSGQGMDVTGLRDIVPWGAYTIAFLAFSAMAAGSLGVGCAAVLAPSSPLSPLAPTGVMTAIAGLVAALVSYVVSLGRVDRVYELVLHPNWDSPLIWSLAGIVVTLIIASVLLVMLRDRHPEAESTAARYLAAGGILVAVMTVGATGAIFTVPVGRAGWSSLVVPLFLVSAALAGLATVMLVARGWGLAGISHHSATRDRLSRLVVVALVAELALTALGYLSAASSPQKWAAMQLVLPGGGWSWLFWVQWVVGGIVPLALLVPPSRRRRHGMMEAGAGLAMLGMVVSYVALVPGDLASPRITLAPGMAVGVSRPGFSSFRMLGWYNPTWSEYGVLVGLVCLFFAVLALIHIRHENAVRAA